MLVASVSFSFVAGTDFELEFAVTDEDDEVANIAGTDVQFVVARDGVVALSTEDGTATATITDAAGGLFQVSVDAANTMGLLGTYRFQAQLTDASGDIATVSRGFMTFTENLLALAS